jgi:hypothetical protein
MKTETKMKTKTKTITRDSPRSDRLDAFLDELNFSVAQRAKFARPTSFVTAYRQGKLPRDLERLLDACIDDLMFNNE